VSSPVVSLHRTWRPGWPCDPFDVLRPLRRGGGDPTLQRDPDGVVWRAARTPDGAATLRIRPRPATGEIDLEAWGSGAAWMMEQAPLLLGAGDDVCGFESAYARVRRAWSWNPHWRVARSGLVLEALVAAVLEQKVTGREAWLGWRRLLSRFGERAPGPGGARGMRCLPEADAIARIPSWEWLRCSVDGARSATIVRASRVADALERTLHVPPGEAERALVSVPGVGVWTAAEVRQRAHGDADAVSFGDLHVAPHIGWALTGAPVSDDGLRELLETERPHRYRVQHIVTTRLAGVPRRGPRMAPRRHLPV
jgi:3-methyladenine DNA glycosylase/8-oxoguanine DNA glycosylase